MAGPNGLDWAWGTSTGGTLTAEQRRRVAAAFVRVSPQVISDRIKVAFGRRGQGRLEFADLRLPDSGLAKAAESEARETLSPVLLGHSVRTYLFGRVLAGIDQVSYDDELVYVASLLHDIRLETPEPGRCFAVRGGEYAAGFAVRHGTDADRAQAIGAAISAHPTPGVADDLSDPGGFVSAGAAADVIGSRISELDPDWVSTLLARHPRHDFKRRFTAAVRAEAQAVPRGRMAWLRSKGFGLIIRVAPFDE